MNLALNRGFRAGNLTVDVKERLEEKCRHGRGDILTMTTLAGSGHPGGSMSSIEMFMTLYSLANISPTDPYNVERDRIVVSHGHTSPGIYATLGRLGFFPLEEAIAFFRKCGSPFEGHIERNLPGIEWSTGNLGQGLSAGSAFALSARLNKRDGHVFVVMGDGEQQKGQIAEARRFAKKYGLTNLTALVDYNRLQISGDISDVMPQNIGKNFESDGWKVSEIDGHDIDEIYGALHEAISDEENPSAIIAKTVMGKGVSFMENEFEYHGKALPEGLLKKAMVELGLEDRLEEFKKIRSSGKLTYIPPEEPRKRVVLNMGAPLEYGKDEKTDNRSAFGNTLKDLAVINRCGNETPIIVLDCDLAGSVKTGGFSKECPQHFFESGIQEHHTAVLAGALSTTGALVFFADFGVFGICETYNQQRLNDINEANLKLVCTHLGLDVGEDGKTHQCIDYLGLMRNTFGFRVIIPADPNQTDRVIRFISFEEGNFMVGMGRSKLPVILNSSDRPFFGGTYTFTPGKADLLREGNRGTIFTYGTMVHRAIQAWENLKAKGIAVNIFNVSTPSEPDMEALRQSSSTGLIVTYEDHNVHTGLGNVLGDAIASEGLTGVRFIKMGVDRYGSSGRSDDVYEEMGLSSKQLVDTILNNI